MTILHPTTSTSHHPHAVRDSWIAIALSPVGLVAAVLVALLLGGGGTVDLWLPGAALAVAALVAPTVALVEARAADRHGDHGAGLALAASVVDWLMVVTVLAVAVVSPMAVLVGLTVSVCVILAAWGAGEPSGSR
ncbi:MAG: hypothetical protein U0R68_12490 [Candidatus Nanopelagicales bacterium]